MTIVKSISLGEPAFDYLGERFVLYLALDQYMLWTSFELVEDSNYVGTTLVEEYFVVAYSITGDVIKKKVNDIYFMSSLDVIDDFNKMGQLKVPTDENTPKKCDCPMNVLWNRGCQCGGV